MSSIRNKSNERAAGKDEECVKHGIKKVKRMQQGINSLCDDSSSSENESFAKSNSVNLRKTISKHSSRKGAIENVKDGDNSSVHISRKSHDSFLKSKIRMTSKSSDDDTVRTLQSRTEFSSSLSIENSENELPKSNKHKNSVKNKKVSRSNARKEIHRTKKSESSDLEDQASVKSVGKRKKKHASSESVHQKLDNLHKEESDSGSGKHFQKSKSSHGGMSITKKLSEFREEHKKSTMSDSSSTKQSTEKTAVGKEQSLRFKSRAIKILNKFKEICSEYEIHMEHVKWKHFKKEVKYEETAYNIIRKSKDVISNLKLELEAQEEELMTFYEEWRKSCSSKNSDDEDTSSSEEELSQKTDEKKQSDKSEAKSSQNESMISDCDNGEIFSEAEKEDGEAGDKTNKESEATARADKLDESVTKDGENTASTETRSDSPILGGNGENKTSEEIPDDVSVHSADTVRCHEHGDSEPPSVLNDTNNSGVDMFDETGDIDKGDENVAEQSSLDSEKDNNATIAPEPDSNADKTPLGNEESSAEANEDSGANEKEGSQPAASEETPESRTEDDAETVAADKVDGNEESVTEQPSKVSVKENAKEKSKEEERSEAKGKSKSKSNSEDGSKRDGGTTDKEEVSKMRDDAKRGPLDANSNDTVGLSKSKKDWSEKEDGFDDNELDVLAKAALLISSNSDSSGSESGAKSQVRQPDTNSKEQRKENGKDSSEDETRASKVDDRTDRRNITRRQTRSSKAYNGSDEKLKKSCRVVVERLSKNVLEKYTDALDKSRQRLDCKKIKSLIDLEKLERNKKHLGDSPQSSRLKRKKKLIKEREDSLLNHLKKLGNGETVESAEDSDSDRNSESTKTRSSLPTNDELMMEADMNTKKLLLNSSDSDGEDRKISSGSSESETEGSKPNKLTVKSKKDLNDEDDEDDREKSKWRRDKLLTGKFSDSDSDAARKKWNKKQKRLDEKEEEEEQMEHLASKDKVVKRKRRKCRKILDSDSDVQLITSESESDSDSGSSAAMDQSQKSSDSDSSVGKRQKKTRKRKTRKSSDTDSSFGGKRPKPKRKRIKEVTSDSDNDSDNDQMANSQGTPGKKGRKNIRKVLKDTKVADDTKQAAKEEEERIKRIAERQKLYNEMYEARLAGEEKVDKLVLDFNPDTKEELVSVHEDLVKRLKPHQAKGIKFMWDACFETLERTMASSGSGCIIAHCMGLGKTLQVIALTHTLLTHEETGVKTIMIVCPLSTVLNWINEFEMWLKNVDGASDIEIYALTKFKKNVERKYQLESWQRTGGVLVIGYEMFRNLTGTNNKMRKGMKEAVLRYLIDPGPDVIVCDEGHLLKNEDTALSKSMKRIKTLRRIVLTGTPLQNNLVEYHCMVQFVKPSLLGTKREFLNRFVNPISNGQFDDSTEFDVKLMKKRAYVLHKMLKGCVQRFDYSVLMPFLPPKQEYVIFVRLTEVQSKMYRFYLDNFARRQRSATGSLFADFQALQRIWTHPVVLRLNAEKIEKMNEKKFTSSDSEGSLRDFIHDSSASETETSEMNSDDDDVQPIKCNSTRSRRKDSAEVEIIPQVEEKEEKKEEDWWAQFTQPEHFEDLRISAKLQLLFGILKEAEQIGDKVLVFSQSLYSLTLIEQFLDKIDSATQNDTNSELINGHTGSWSLGLDYFRMDGQTSAENRNIWCKIFNKPTNTRARLFLISTRAGGLGINLTAANRVIIFDASWNPSHDVQSIFRVYRFGQKKPCYVYRFLAAGTMEEKIYNRQVTKLSLSCRVVDEQQIERHYSNNDLSELYKFDPGTTGSDRPTLNLPKDRLLAEIFLKYKDFVENYHEHDSLLENKAEEELNEEERKQAWLEYEEEKKGKPIPTYSAMAAFSTSALSNQYNIPALVNVATDYEKLQELIRKDYPKASPECQQMMTTRVLQDMYSYWEQQAFHSTSATQIMNQNTGVKHIQIRPKVSNIVQVPRVMQKTNATVSGQGTDVLPFTFANADPKPGEADDDVVEVLPTPTTVKNKNQEE